MKLDELVCRGTLIIHKQERLVVIGPGVRIVARWGTYNEQQRSGWRIMSTAQLKAAVILITAIRTVDNKEEVDMFFPGNVYPLPDYIK